MKFRVFTYLKKGRAVKTAFVLLVCLGYSLCFGQFAGGQGTEGSPYLVETAEHLNNVRDFLDSHFIQTAEIDLGVPPWNQDEGWVPIGDEDNYFRGSYNGNAKVIRNLYIHRPDSDYQGLFGYGSGCTLRRLGLQDVDVTGNKYVAGLIAYSSRPYPGGTRNRIEQCYVTGKVTGNTYLAGIAGFFVGRKNIVDCYSTAKIFSFRKQHGGFFVGGISGNLLLMESCYAVGAVVTAVLSAFTDMGCGAGAVTGGGTLPIYRPEHLDMYWNTETCAAEQGIGNYSDLLPGSTTQEMTSQDTFVGFDFETVWAIDEGSYPYLRWQDDAAEDHNYPRFLPPFDLEATTEDNSIILSWEPPDENFSVPDGYNIYRNGELINDELIEICSYEDMDLIESRVYDYQVRAVYDEQESQSTRIVKAFIARFAGGLGTEEDPYLIANSDQLNLVRYFPAEHFKQIADIDLAGTSYSEGEGWVPIGRHLDWHREVPGAATFTGRYDGNRFAVKNLSIDNSSDVASGLFSSIVDASLVNIRLVDVNSVARQGGGLADYTSNSYIKNCSVTGSIATEKYSGGIVGIGRDSTVIRNSFFEGKVNGKSRVGGIAGTFLGESGIIECYSAGKVSLRQSYGIEHPAAGGIAGKLGSSLIRDSYSTADVSGEYCHVGGLVGKMDFYPSDDLEILRSYSTGTVTLLTDFWTAGGFVGTGLASEVTAGYWDMETSGMDESMAGEGRTTLQMTYPYCEETYVGWDFADIWGSDDDYWVNNGYPYLQWQINHFPKTAVNPVPEDDSEDISVLLEELKWSFYPDSAYINPAGFRVYFSETPDFADASFSWVYYHAEKTEFFCYKILPEELAYNTTYYWQVIPTTKEEGTGEGEDAVNCPVWSFTTEIDTSVEPEGAQPLVTELLGNHPNPFNPETVLKFNIKEETEAALSIYNIRGQLVRNLHSGPIKAGVHRIIWDGKDDSGRDVGSGVFFYRLKTDDYDKVNKMLLVK